jgi:hypothetical protein
MARSPLFYLSKAPIGVVFNIPWVCVIDDLLDNLLLCVLK